MKAEEAARKAVDSIRRYMSEAEGDEASVLDIFIGELEAELEGLKMRETELEENQDESC